MKKQKETHKNPLYLNKNDVSNPKCYTTTSNIHGMIFYILTAQENDLMLH